MGAGLAAKGGEKTRSHDRTVILQTNNHYRRAMAKGDGFPDHSTFASSRLRVNQGDADGFGREGHGENTGS